MAATASTREGRGARLAVFSISHAVFVDVKRWLVDAGHELALVVAKPTPAGLQVAEAAGKTTVLLAPEVAQAGDLVRELGVDLCVVAAFSRIPDDLAAVPPRGFVNLHPSLLPEYPGPNPYRAIFEGVPVTGFTCHRITGEFDAGPILAQAAFDVPVPVDPVVLGARWSAALVAALAEGIPKALAGDPGAPQPEGTGTFAAPFDEAEAVLDWDLPVRVLERRTAALMMAGIQPVGRIGDGLAPVRRLRQVPELESRRRGVVTSGARRALVGVGDGVVEVDLGELPH